MTTSRTLSADGRSARGWDNSTAFLAGVLVGSPDLSAYLVVQMDTLAVVADRLGRAMPLVAGRRLPEPLGGHILNQLDENQLGERGPHLTAHGMAGEPPSSAAYEPDGFWRGPIWAPVTFLLIEACAYSANPLADAVSRPICNLIAASGPAENFDAIDDRGLRDRPAGLSP